MVDPSPISLLFITGDALTAEGEALAQDSCTAPTMAYFTSIDTLSSLENVPASLHGQALQAQPGVGLDQATWCASLAEEWVAQTGERVWLVNAPYAGGTYEGVCAVFDRALETLYREVEAGHFALHHMAYYWFAEGEPTAGAAAYREQLAKLHEDLQKAVVYQHNGVEKRLEYGGIVSLRAAPAMTEARLALYEVGGETGGVLANLYLVADTVGGADRYAALGTDAAHNSLHIINRRQPQDRYPLACGEEETVTALLLAQDGVTPWGETAVLDSEDGAYFFPSVSPLYAISQGLSLRVETEGLALEGYRLKITGSYAPSSVTFSLYLGGERYQTYTVQLSLGSSFSQHLPAYTLTGSKYTLQAQSGAWRCGYLTYQSGVFTPFSEIDKSGWLYDGRVLWGNGSHGAFCLTNGLQAALAEGDASCTAIEYRAPYSGRLAVCAAQLSPGLHDVYLAIAVNGEMVWPTAGGALTDRAGAWYRVEAEAADAATLTAAWAGLALDVEQGDSVTFLLAYADGTDGPLLYPTVYYKPKE